MSAFEGSFTTTVVEVSRLTPNLIRIVDVVEVLDTLDAEVRRTWRAGTCGCRPRPGSAVRKYLRAEHAYPTDRAHTVGYWRFDSEAWARTFEPLAQEMLAHHYSALEEGLSEEEASERYDAAPERAGL